MDNANLLVVGSWSTNDRQSAAGTEKVNSQLSTHAMSQGHGHLHVLQHVEAVARDVVQGHCADKKDSKVS